MKSVEDWAKSVTSILSLPKHNSQENGRWRQDKSAIRHQQWKIQRIKSRRSKTMKWAQTIGIYKTNETSAKWTFYFVRMNAKWTTLSSHIINGVYIFFLPVWLTNLSTNYPVDIGDRVFISMDSCPKMAPNLNQSCRNCRAKGNLEREKNVGDFQPKFRGLTSMRAIEIGGQIFFVLIDQIVIFIFGCLLYPQILSYQFYLMQNIEIDTYKYTSFVMNITKKRCGEASNEISYSTRIQ